MNINEALGGLGGSKSKISSKRMVMSCNQLEISHVPGCRNYIGSHPLQSPVFGALEVHECC